MMQIREVVPEDENDLLKILETTRVFKGFKIATVEVFRNSMIPAPGGSPKIFAIIPDFYSQGDTKTTYGKNFVS